MSSLLRRFSQRKRPAHSLRPAALQTADPPVDQTTNSLAHNSATDNIMRLPNEILDIIASHVVPDHTVEVMEGIPRLGHRKPNQTEFDFIGGEASQARKWCQDLQSARNFALVCWRFSAIMERWMYVHISLLEKRTCTCCTTYPRTSLPYLVRTLLEKPYLAKHCVRLDAWMRDRRLVSDGRDMYSKASPYYDSFEKARRYAIESAGAQDELSDWSMELRRHSETALHAVLISMLPSLKDLRMHAPMSRRTMFEFKDKAHRERNPYIPIDTGYFDTVLRKSPVTSIHLGVAWPIWFLPEKTLTTMEIDIMFFMDRDDFLGLHVLLLNVHTVAVIINLTMLQGANLADHTTTLDAQVGLKLFLRDIVPNIKNFAIEMPRGNLEVSNKSASHDRHGNLHPTIINMSDDMHDIERMPLDDRDNLNAWDWLLEVLHPIRNRLTSFSLPRNWYSSTGFLVKSMPSLAGFTRLETLSLPRVALVSNPNSVDYDPSDDCAAENFLPRNLVTLVIFQADVESCAWVQGAFAEKHLHFPKWKYLGLAFRNDVMATLPYGFEVQASAAELEVKAFWRGCYEVVALP